ncbi:DUF935 domain-containing protein [Phenylobacterium sp.]|uniref:DUF935 domain-containing protein n=1 Tax=Phenylobacterium sp. TaxID=1871053 RepID=UPI00391C6B8D
MAQLLDHRGQPIKVNRKALAEEVARPSLTGVRQAWDPASAVAGLTPERLDAILRQANQGDLHAFLTLAEEMEERDPHYGSVLQTRKLAVLGLERKLTWSKGKEDDPRAAEIQEACEDLLQADEMDDLVGHLLDAIAKGYAAPEICWSTAGQWRPERYEWRDPRHFEFDRETGRELRLKEAGAVGGLPLEPYKFAVHIASRKSGLPARGGLARLVAFSFVCKLYGLKDWMAYAEIFGIPLRLGRYDGSASPDDVAVLKRAVFGLGSDAAAVLPKSMDIEFPELGKATGGAELFQALVTWIDNQVSKAVLGQTGTTDMQSGGGFAQSKVLNEVRADLTKADAKGVGGAITRAVLTPFVLFNWGPDAPVPRAELVIEEPEDVQVLGEALERLVPLGLRVGQAEIRKKLRLSEPAQDEEILAPPAEAAAAATEAPADGEDADRRGLGRNGSRPALARQAGAGGVDDELDEIQQLEFGEWRRTFGPEAARVVDLVRGAGSFDEIVQGLETMAGDLAAPEAARSLARAMFQAAVLGDGRARRKGA